jgi:hypothetical protein
LKRPPEQVLGKPNLKQLKVLTVSEVCFGSAHKFLSTVSRWKMGAIGFVGKVEGQDVVKASGRPLGGLGQAARQ